MIWPLPLPTKQTSLISYNFVHGLYGVQWMITLKWMYIEKHFVMNINEEDLQEYSTYIGCVLDSGNNGAFLVQFPS